MEEDCSCTFRDIYLREGTSHRLAIPVLCRVLKIWDSGSNVVNECCAHGILTDGECKIAATFSEKSIAEFEGSSTSLHMQLEEGAFIDVNEYIFYTPIEDEQNSCAIVLWIDSFEKTSEIPTVHQVNERLELLSVDPAIKERLQYFWSLAQLMKGWSMDNECIMEVPEVLEAISAIPDEDRKKLSDIVRFKGSMHDGMMMSDGVRVVDERENNEKHECITNDNRLQFSEELSVGTCIDEDKGDSQNDGVMLKSPKYYLGDALGEADQNTDGNANRNLHGDNKCTLVSNEDLSDTIMNPPSERIELRFASESTSDSEIYEHCHIEQSQGFLVSESVCRVVETNVSQCAAVSSDSSIETDANKNSDPGHEMQVEREVSEGERISDTKDNENKSKETGVVSDCSSRDMMIKSDNIDPSLKNSTEASSESEATEHPFVLVSSSLVDDRGISSEEIDGHTSPTRPSDESSPKKCPENAIVKEFAIEIKAKVARDSHDDEHSLGMESQEPTSGDLYMKRKRVRYMPTKESKSPEGTSVSHDMVEKGEEVIEHDTNLPMTSNILSLSTKDNHFAIHNTDDKIDSESKDTKGKVKHILPSEELWGPILKFWVNDKDMPATPDIKQKLQLLHHYTAK